MFSLPLEARAWLLDLDLTTQLLLPETESEGYKKEGRFRICAGCSGVRDPGRMVVVPMFALGAYSAYLSCLASIPTHFLNPVLWSAHELWELPNV